MLFANIKEMAIEIKKNAKIIFKDPIDNLVHILPETEAGLVAYGDGSTVADALDQALASVDAKADADHSHGEITSDGKIGDTAGLPLITGEDGLIEAGSFGTEQGTFVEGNDARLSDARTPLPHEQASSTITSLEGYQKSISFSALSSSDTLNIALGKLERQLDKVQGTITLGREEVSDDAELQTASSNELRIVSCTGESTVSLPSFDSSVNSEPTSYWIRNAGTDTVTVACGDGASVNGSTDPVELLPGESILVVAETDGEYSIVSDGRWQSAADSKVDKVDGKGLSSNDFTDALKTKLEGIAEGANEYTLPAATTESRGGVTIGGNINVSGGTISVADASTSAKGVVQLSSAVNSESEALAATPKAVKTAYDLASSKQDPATTLAGYGISDAYQKSEIDQMLDTAMHYKGSVASYVNLPSSGNAIGDFYNVEDTGRNYAYTGVEGSEWDLMGNTTEFGTITSEEIHAIVTAD